MSSIQKARRQNPYPWTWEIPLLLFVLVLLGLAVGAQVGRSAANVLAGAGWTWPVDQPTFWRSIPDVLGGNAAAGLTNPVGAGQLPEETASPALLWSGIGAVELLLLLAAGGLAVRGLRRWGPSRLKGMSTRPEAEQMLGLTRLRKVSPIIRPDLLDRHSELRSVRRNSGDSTDQPGPRLGGGLTIKVLHRDEKEKR